MARRNLDLLAVAALAALATLAVAATHDAAVRAVPGSLLVLFAPGYALSVALLPSRPGDHFERLLLALGSSISVAVVAAVVLDETTAGLTARSWCVSLTAVTLVACAVGSLRRRPPPLGGDTAATPAATARHRRVPFARIGLACVALAMVAGALVIARLPASNVQGFTLLWAVPRDTALGVVAVGLKSDESATTTYLLTAVSGSNIVIRRRVTLRPGESWRTMATVVPRTPSARKVLEVSLYRTKRPETVYRRVHLALGAFGS